MMTTNSGSDAFNDGVRAVLDIAAKSAIVIRAETWKPGREGAANALEALAEAGTALLMVAEEKSASKSYSTS